MAGQTDLFGVDLYGRRTADIEMEQDMDRPYVYVSSRFAPSGFSIISIEDPENAEVIYKWVVDNPMLHQGSGALDGKYFESGGRYYYIQSYQFRAGGPDSDLGAIIFDVTGLPDPSQVREVGRMQGPAQQGGFHNIFAYKHSDGRNLLFATIAEPAAHVYDLDLFLAGDPDFGLIARVPNPSPNRGPRIPRLLRRVPPRERTGPLLWRRGRRVLRLRHHGPGQPGVPHVGDQHLGDQGGAHHHAHPRRPVLRGRNRVSDGTPAHLRPQARARR